MSAILNLGIRILISETTQLAARFLTLQQKFTVLEHVILNCLVLKCCWSHFIFLGTGSGSGSRTLHKYITAICDAKPAMLCKYWIH